MGGRGDHSSSIRSLDGTSAELAIVHTMDTVRIGVIGLGNMGSGHVKENIPKVARLKLGAVCDLVEQRLQTASEVPGFTSASELIHSGLVDAVLIATPHYGHTTIGIEALNAGLHVLVEKPISVHKADCQRLIASHTGKSVFAAMFNQRTDPHYLAIRNLIQSGELGEISRINWIITNWFRTATYYTSGGWRATWGGEGGGVLLNQCPHNLDLYQWLFGMPSRVRAFCQLGKFHDIEVEDAVTAYLEHPNGATGIFVTTTGEAPGTNRLEVVGDRGKVVYEDGRITFTRTTVSVKEFCATSSESFGAPTVWNCEIPVSGYGGQHLEVLRNFVDAILDGKPLIAPAQEGIHSVELANAMLYSSFTGQTMEIPIDAEAYETHLKELIRTSTHRKLVDNVGPQDLAGSVR